MTPIAVGSPAPEIGLRDQHGSPRRLAEARGRAPVLLLFFPYAFSRTCTGELRALRTHRDRLAATGAEVWGLTCDATYTLRSWADAERLELPLLSDFWPHGAVTAAYGLLDDERGCPRRASVLVDVDGVVAWTDEAPPGRARDLEVALAAVARL